MRTKQKSRGGANPFFVAAVIFVAIWILLAVIAS
jgi:hypothetical protein